MLKMFQKLKDCKWILLYIILAGLLTFAISQKSYFYIDEYAEYGLSNVEGNIIKFFTNAVSENLVSDNIKYTPASALYTKLTSVPADRQFDYTILKKNIENDTTPPLHYVLTHTVCSFFPGVFSKWFVGIINIVFALLTLLVTSRLLRLFTDDEQIVIMILLVIVCSSALINAATYLRAYIMAMFFVTLQSYFLVKQIGQPITKKFCLNIFAATMFGTLTHYYCALYAVLSSILFGILLLKDKNWNGFAKFSATQMLAGVAACVVFPPIFLNILKFGLGAQNMAQAFGMSFIEVATYPELLLFYLKLSNEKLFGGTLFLIIPIMLFFGYMNILSKSKRAKDVIGKECAYIYIRRYMLILLPVICFCVLVTRRNMRISWVALNMDYRYWQPVWVLILIGMLVYLFENIKKYFANRSRYIYLLLSCL